MNSALLSTKQFIENLRRRKVFRAAAAYLVAAWLVIAVADVIIPVLRLPDWTMNLVILIAVTGLPIAIAISWLFDWSPAGMVRTTEESLGDAAPMGAGSMILSAIAGAVVVAVGFLLWRPFDQIPADGINSIAVLPFADFSEQHDAGYLGDGLAEELLNALVGVDGLHVAARTSSFAFKGLNEDVRSIGQKLNVDTVLEGSVRRFGDRVRVTAQLIKVSDGFHLWSETYDRKLDDIFAIQDDIALAIVAALRLKLGAGADQRMARASGTNFEAYDLYLLGRHHWHQRTPASLQRAVELFTEAAETDPDFALAYSGLADAYLLLRDYGDLDETVAITQAEAAIARALQLDNQLAEPYASLGLLRMSRRELTGAELAFRNAIQLDSSYSMAHMWLGLVLDQTQGPQAAFEEYRAAYSSDPLHPVINGNLARALARMGRYDQARDYLQRSEAANPDAAGLRVHLSWLDSYFGRLDESVQWALNTDARNSDAGDKLRMMLAANFARMGDLDKASSYLGSDDPRSESALEFDTRALVLFAGGEYARLAALARERMDRSTAGHKVFQEHVWSGLAHIAQNDFAAAVTDFEAVLELTEGKGLEGSNYINTLGLIAHGYGELGNLARRDEYLSRAVAVYERERSRGWDSPEFHAAAAATFAMQGDHNGALRALSTATRGGWREYHWLLTDPRFAALRDNPDFRQLANTMRSELDAMLVRATELVNARLVAR